MVCMTHPFDSGLPLSWRSRSARVGAPLPQEERQRPCRRGDGSNPLRNRDFGPKERRGGGRVLLGGNVGRGNGYLMVTLGSGGRASGFRLVSIPQGEQDLEPGPRGLRTPARTARGSGEITQPDNPAPYFRELAEGRGPGAPPSRCRRENLVRTLLPRAGASPHAGRRVGHGHNHQDRKSTRLNS